MIKTQFWSNTFDIQKQAEWRVTSDGRREPRNKKRQPNTLLSNHNFAISVRIISFAFYFISSLLNEFHHCWWIRNTCSYWLLTSWSVFMYICVYRWYLTMLWLQCNSLIVLNYFFLFSGLQPNIFLGSSQFFHSNLLSVFIIESQEIQKLFLSLHNLSLRSIKYSICACYLYTHLFLLSLSVECCFFFLASANSACVPRFWTIDGGATAEMNHPSIESLGWRLKTGANFKFHVCLSNSNMYMSIFPSVSTNIEPMYTVQLPYTHTWR